jgi:hypothetical protein
VQPQDVLKLIGSASQRYDTVRAALRYRGDRPTHKEIREPIARTEAGRHAFGEAVTRHGECETAVWPWG